jgi:hypothetical protein
VNWDLVQHAVVTLAAIGASGVLLREVAAFLFPRKGAPTCSQCSSGAQQSRKRGARTGETVVLQIQGRRRG